MKNILLTLLTLLLFVGKSNATPKVDFDKVLEVVENIVEKGDSEDFYQSWQFEDKKTGTIKKFKDFEKINRSVFIFMQINNFSKKLGVLNEKWKQELDKAEVTPKDVTEASKKDIEDYMSKLLILRKKMALNTETFLEDMFKKFPDKFTKEEKDFIVNDLKTYNDKNNLIER